MVDDIGQGLLLIAEDETVARDNLSRLFEKAGYRVIACADGDQALEALRSEPVDVLLTDLRMPGLDGLQLLARSRELRPETQVILLTAYTSLEDAVEAMKRGAFHYLAKPYRLDEVRELVARALELARLRRENQSLRTQLAELPQRIRIISQNRAMERLLETARRFAASDSNTLIGGESGTGKELLARFIHEHSNRRDGPFVAINCGALHEELLAAELFGHEKGAFTGAQATKKGLIEAAAGGTLFLDEIGETSPAMQVKLLRVIEQRELLRVGGTRPLPVDLRWVAATNRDLIQAIEQGRFRRDLYFRLNVAELHLPPLRERRDDIPLLAHHFLHQKGDAMEHSAREIAPETLRILQRYDYPGNVRELSNLIERALALAEGSTLEPRHLPPHLRKIQAEPAPAEPLPTLQEHEEAYIRKVLQYTDGNRTQAAEILNIDRVSLWRKLKKMGD